jgi:outer membrane biosynthesis protein TonB
VDWQSYLKDVERRLKLNWHRAVNHDGKSAAIGFVLQQNHDDPTKIEVQSAHLVTVSGSEEFDSSVSSTVMNTNFRPFPAGADSQQEFRITFDSLPKKR